MKGLTINRVASAILRARRKSYRGLALGVLLAVLFCCASSLCALGVVRARERDMLRRTGETDCVLYDSPELTDETLRLSGLFDRIGRVFLTACVKDTDLYLGSCDEAGNEILLRDCVEGRLPERAGEIALERSALGKLRLEAELGSAVELALQPIDGAAETRRFTLVGIVNEQSRYLSPSLITLRGEVGWPSAWVSREEPAFSTGRAVVQRVMTYAPFVTWGRVRGHHSLSDALLFPVSHMQGTVCTGDPSEQDAETVLEGTIVVLIIGGALLLCTGIGISSAMESVLAARTEEIGLLRAVGATRRQIRRVFGREPYLLCLVTLPAGIGLGCLTAWLLSLALPGQILFTPEPWLLLPAAALSAACIFLSSALPLRRASRQAPLGVLRDTAMLRRAKSFKSKGLFRPSRLIASRQLRLHPFRQLGAVLMVGLCLFICSWLGELIFEIVGAARPTDTAFLLGRDGGYAVAEVAFANFERLYTMSEQDLAQIRALPHVDQVYYTAGTEADLLLPDGELPGYLRTFYSADAKENGTGEDQYYAAVSTLDWNAGLDWLLLNERSPEPVATTREELMSKEFLDYEKYRYMRAAAGALGTERRLLPIEIYAVSMENRKLDDIVSAGEIDLAALDAGEQVIVQAPAFNVYKSDYTGSYGFSDDATLPAGAQVLARVENDFFQAGQRLELTQLVADSGAMDREAGTEAFYAAARRHDASVTVGAVLNAARAGSAYSACILTTEKGLRALGLEVTQPESVVVGLDRPVDEETEELLERSLEEIAMRADLTVGNLLEASRDNARAYAQVLLLFGGMTLLFFAVSVAMQVGAAARRIRADSRSIGTLRAVGADEKALLGCYRLPVLFSAALGAALGCALYFWSIDVIWGGLRYTHPAVLVPALAVLALLCAAMSLLGIKARLRQVLRQSIVENIREL